MCYGLDAATLARITGTHIATVRRWKRGYPMPEATRRLIVLMTARDLGAFAPAWAGWRIDSSGELVSPEDWRYQPGHVRSIEFLHGMIASYKSEARAAAARLESSKQADWVEQRYVLPGEMRELETSTTETAPQRSFTHS